MNEENNRGSNSPNPNSPPPKINLPIIIAIFIAALVLFSTCTKNDDCGMCNGSGYYQKKTCPACNGSGNSDYDPYEQYQGLFD